MIAFANQHGDFEMSLSDKLFFLGLLLWAIPFHVACASDPDKDYLTINETTRAWAFRVSMGMGLAAMIGSAVLGK